MGMFDRDVTVMESESKHDDSSSWGDCPQGALVKMVERLSSERRQERRRPVMRVGAVLLIAAACGIGGSWLVNDNQIPALGGLTCGQCVEYMPTFQERSLDALLSQQVQAHLDGCPRCREHYEIKFSADRGDAISGLAVRPAPAERMSLGVHDRAALEPWVLAIGGVVR